MGIEFTAREHGKGDAPIQEQVEAFVGDMLDDGELRPEYEELPGCEALENAHGEQADELLQEQEQA